MDVSKLIKPEAVQQMLAASFESKLTQSVHDATAELAEVLVKAEIQRHIPALVQQMGGLGSAIFAQQGDALVKAQNAPGKLEQRTQAPVDPKGLLYDPFTALDQMGFRERPTSITYRTLAEMARRVTPYAAYLQTRINQIASFAEPQPDEHSVGFKIRLKDRRAKMTPQLQKDADRLVDWVRRCGNPDVKVKRKNFGHYLRMTTWDALVYDQYTAEVVPDRRGKPCYWRPLDAATIRISDDLDETDDTDETIQYVQVYDDTIIAEFTERELMFGVRNPRSDIRYAGYGVSELELLIVIVTALLNGIDYNAAFFKQGTVAKGIINFKGAIPDKELVAFRRQWYAMLTGVGNAWRTPVVNADDLQYVNMQVGNRDMEFSSWIDWLLKLTCAVVQIAPEEIGFQFGNGGQTSSLSEGNQEEKLKFSKDKGLVPLAKFHAEQLNRGVIDHLDDRFELELAGINARSAEELIELQTKEVGAIKTVDEARQERGLKPLSGGRGDVILNQTWLAFVQGQQQGGGAGAPGVPQGASFDKGGLDGQPGQQNPDDDDEEGDDDGGPSQQQRRGFAAMQGDQMEKALRSSAPVAPRGRILDLEIDV